jgi:hypothetical protein
MLEFQPGHFTGERLTVAVTPRVSVEAYRLHLLAGNSLAPGLALPKQDFAPTAL